MSFHTIIKKSQKCLTDNPRGLSNLNYFEFVCATHSFSLECSTGCIMAEFAVVLKTGWWDFLSVALILMSITLMA